ncbi:MAG: ATP-binding cassette domain-containing protein [Planktomarina sp.]|nr:ATP-binding cassette domain-containing protein [Planktomarina sp.]MDS9947243.1 ATP-binding cassette domain-containing protein [Planktomarina sp.]|tara:strand:+ start:4902 stop:5603 length:702 start_codon:yes stop_codon:yes gene_type:complete
MLHLNKIEFTQGSFSLVANFTIQTGARVAVIGPSGEGKSTLLHGIAGFLKPTRGNICWAGEPMPSHPGLRPLSLLFQDHNLFPHLTVFNNVAIGLNPGLRLSAPQKKQVSLALQKVGLQDQNESYPGDLSGGQRGRIGLARVLLRERPLLLLDEPFAALGPALKDEMLEVLDNVMSSNSATALMVTHDPQDALIFADQAILVADGYASEPQPIRELFDDPPPALKAYLGNRTQ